LHASVIIAVSNVFIVKHVRGNVLVLLNIFHCWTALDHFRCKHILFYSSCW